MGYQSPVTSPQLPDKKLMTKEAGYKKLIVWQKANELAYQIYQATENFPKTEVFGMTSQLRRAALSVPVNIVEGSARHGKKELKQFLNIAMGSLAETEYLIDFSLKLKYLRSNEHEELQNLRKETGNLLWKFFQSVK